MLGVGILRMVGDFRRVGGIFGLWGYFDFGGFGKFWEFKWVKRVDLSL
jgi:hypothetical protein